MEPFFVIAMRLMRKDELVDKLRYMKGRKHYRNLEWFNVKTCYIDGRDRQDLVDSYLEGKIDFDEAIAGLQQGADSKRRRLK